METFLFRPNIYNTGVIRSLKPNSNVGDFTYVRTGPATRRDAQGGVENLAANIPQLDYTNGGCPELLLEPERTNLIPNSNRGNYGNPPSSELRVDGITDGVQAYVPVPDGESDRYQYVLLSPNIDTGDIYTYSWYTRQITTPTGITSLGNLNFRNTTNISSIEVTKIQSDVNGFDRFQAVFSILDGSTNAVISGNFADVVGVGNQSVAYDGHQLEEGSFATSLIPTSGSAQIRNLPSVTSGGDSTIINSLEGVLMFEGSSFGDGGSRLISISASATNTIYLGYSSTLNRIVARYLVDGDLTRIITSFVPDTTIKSKYAVRYSSSAFSLWIDGIMIQEISITNSFTSGILNELALNRSGSRLNFEGRLRQIRYHNVALTDAEMETLTTI